MPDTPRNQAAEPVQPYWDAPVLHSLTFQKNTLNGRFRAMCSCGWARTGAGEDESNIRVAAATHDIEWVDELNAQRFPTAHS